MEGNELEPNNASNTESTVNNKSIVNNQSEISNNCPIVESTEQVSNADNTESTASKQNTDNSESNISIVNKQSETSNDSNVEPNTDTTEQICNVKRKVNKERDISTVNNQSGTSKKSTVNKQSSGTKNKQRAKKGAVAGAKAGHGPKNVSGGTPRPKFVVEGSLAEGMDFQSVQGSNRPATESPESEEETSASWNDVVISEEVASAARLLSVIPVLHTTKWTRPTVVLTTVCLP